MHWNIIRLTILDTSFSFLLVGDDAAYFCLAQTNGIADVKLDISQGARFEFAEVQMKAINDVKQKYIYNEKCISIHPRYCFVCYNHAL